MGQVPSAKWEEKKVQGSGFTVQSSGCAKCQVSGKCRGAGTATLTDNVVLGTVSTWFPPENAESFAHNLAGCVRMECECVVHSVNNFPLINKPKS
jgi:hypothetical protein